MSDLHIGLVRGQSIYRHCKITSNWVRSNTTVMARTSLRASRVVEAHRYDCGAMSAREHAMTMRSSRTRDLATASARVARCAREFRITTRDAVLGHDGIECAD